MSPTAKQQLLDKIQKVKRYILNLRAEGHEVVLFRNPLIEEPATLSPREANNHRSMPPKRPLPKVVISEPKNEFEKIEADVRKCQKCQLVDQRKQPVFGEGDSNARLVFVGEAPGSEEDRVGRPFVGADGELLTKIIESIGLKREDVYICNVLKCRPPGNRNPSLEEIENCKQYLDRQLAYLNPEIICALGTFAAQVLLDSKDPIGKLRGKQYNINGIIIIPTFHPAALLYHPKNKRFVWEDMKLISKLLNQPLNQTN